MRLLDRYQLRELLTALGYCLVGILIFWMAFELLGEMEDIKRHDLGAWDVGAYLVHRLPLYLLLQIPVALLLSLLYALTQHARFQELVAMRAAGLSLWRIALPYLAVGFVLSLVLLYLNEYVVPDAAERAEAVLNRPKDGSDPSSKRWRLNLNFRDQPTGRIWSLRGFNVDTTELRGAHIQWRGAEGGREELIADRGRWEDGAWVFEGVTRFSFSTNAEAVAETMQTNRLVVADFPETPAHLRSEVKISRMLGSLKRSRQVQLSLREIRTYQELHHQLAPQFDALLRTWFHDRLATPWTCLVVVLIAVPAGAAAGRRNVFVGVATSIFFAFAFFVVKEFSLATGAGGYLAPWLAAWLPNLVFGAAGALALQRTR